MVLTAGARIISMDSNEHEAAIVGETMLREMALCQRNTAQRFDGIGVELQRLAD